MGRSVIDDWVEFCLGYVEVGCPVGLGRGVEISEREKRYIGLTRPRLLLMFKIHFLASRMAQLAIGQLT